MKTDLIQETPVTTVQRKVVGGTHITKHTRARLTLKRSGSSVLVNFGGVNTSSGEQYVNAPDLRELAELFNAMADTLDAEQAARDEEAPF